MPAARPAIGSYKKPIPDNIEITDKRPVPEETPNKALADGLRDDLKSDVADSTEAAEKTKSYEEILKENDIEKEKALNIVDDLLTKGFYEEDMFLTRNITVTLRTRSHSDYIRYLHALEALNPRYQEEQNEIQLRYFLAASLVAFKGKVFSRPEGKVTDAEETKLFDERLDWLEKQPETLINLMAVKLSKFDRVVQLVMSEGVIENF